MFKECTNLNHNMYNIDPGAVEAVFFAVVPDSFMNSESSERSTGNLRSGTADWPDILETPVLAPRDPWSF